MQPSELEKSSKVLKDLHSSVHEKEMLMNHKYAHILSKIAPSSKQFLTSLEQQDKFA
jgi:hypothetical protein